MRQQDLNQASPVLVSIRDIALLAITLYFYIGTRSFTASFYGVLPFFIGTLLGNASLLFVVVLFCCSVW